MQNTNKNEAAVQEEFNENEFEQIREQLGEISEEDMYSTDAQVVENMKELVE